MEPSERTDLKGCILLTANKVPMFLGGLLPSDIKNSTCVIANFVSIETFRRFWRYAQQMGLFGDGGIKVVCDLATLKMLYAEFEEMEQNQELTGLLYKNGIQPPTPEVIGLSELYKIKKLNTLSPSVSGLNFWLEKTRRFKEGLRRVFPFGRIRQIQ